MGAMHWAGSLRGPARVSVALGGGAVMGMWLEFVAASCRRMEAQKNPGGVSPGFSGSWKLPDSNEMTPTGIEPVLPP